MIGDVKCGWKASVQTGSWTFLSCFYVPLAGSEWPPPTLPTPGLFFPLPWHRKLLFGRTDWGIEGPEGKQLWSSLHWLVTPAIWVMSHAGSSVQESIQTEKKCRSLYFQPRDAGSVPLEILDHLIDKEDLQVWTRFRMKSVFFGTFCSFQNTSRKTPLIWEPW